MKQLLASIKNFLYKKSYDFNRPDVCLYNFHPQLRMVIAINGIFFNKRKSLYRFVNPLGGISIAATGLCMQYIFITHFLDIKHYEYATECFCYAVVLGITPMVFISFLTNKHKIYNIIDKMNQDFVNICRLGARYREPFLKGQLIIWQLCYAWVAFILVVSGTYVVLPMVTLIYQSLFSTLDEHYVRPLSFRMWLPHDDPYRSPNYEVFLVLQSYLIIAFVQTFCVYVYTLFHILLHYYTIMDMIKLDFEVLFDGLEESVAKLPRYHPSRVRTQAILNHRVGNIVKKHISVFDAVKTVSSVYGPPLVYQVMFSSIVICLTAYQIAEKLNQGHLDILFCMLSSAAILQLWIPCYLGTMLRNQAYSVGDACWNCGWHLTSLGVMVRSDLLIIIQRAQQPVTIQFVGLPNVELETFSTLMSKAYSYFNMLRQYS